MVAFNTAGCVIKRLRLSILMQAVADASLIWILYEPTTNPLNVPDACQLVPPLMVYS